MAKPIGIRPGFAILALVSTHFLAKASSLKGNWVWNEHTSPGDASIQRLEFLRNHKVAGLSYLPDVFSGLSSGGKGEVLEGDAYDYKLSSKEIVLRAGMALVADGQVDMV